MESTYMNEHVASQQDIDQMIVRSFAQCAYMTISREYVMFYFADGSCIRYYDPGTGYREITHCPKSYSANGTVFYTEYEPAFSFDIWSL